MAYTSAMDAAIAAALAATAGFAVGDVFTALLARRVSGRASLLLLSLMKLGLYVPFALLIHREFAAVDATVLWWSLLLGALFFAAYWGFNMSLQVAQNPALAGVVAGCFPASAAVVAIVFLGQRPSLLTLVLLGMVLLGVALIGLPENWRRTLKLEKGVALALIPLVCWGIFGALLHKPVAHLEQPHGWFVVQALVAVVLAVASVLMYNRQAPALLRDTGRKRAWWLVLAAGSAIGMAEAAQALALGSGRQLVIIEGLLGSYPAVYFLIAHKIFREPLHRRQWAGIALVAVAIMLLSVAGVNV